MRSPGVSSSSTRVKLFIQVDPVREMRPVDRRQFIHPYRISALGQRNVKTPSKSRRICLVQGSREITVIKRLADVKT